MLSIQVLVFLRHATPPRMFQSSTFGWPTFHGPSLPCHTGGCQVFLHYGNLHMLYDCLTPLVGPSKGIIQDMRDEVCSQCTSKNIQLIHHLNTWWFSLLQLRVYSTFVRTSITEFPKFTYLYLQKYSIEETKHLALFYLKKKTTDTPFFCTITPCCITFLTWLL